MSESGEQGMDSAGVVASTDNQDVGNTDSGNWMAFEALMREYTSLKSEQANRIGFRDNLLYMTMGAVGAVFAFNTTNPNFVDSILVIPWITFILGWTYVVNDNHISQLGRFIRDDLTVRIQNRFPEMLLQGVFNWEPYHRADPSRDLRKTGQLLVDLFAFVLPSAVSLIYYAQQSTVSKSVIALMIIEMLMALILALAIIYYADPFKSISRHPEVDRVDNKTDSISKTDSNSNP